MNFVRLLPFVLWIPFVLANPNCENEANPDQIAVERVVRIALGVKAIQSQDLEKFVSRSDIPHPFGQSPKQPENLSLKQSFWNHWSKLKGAQRQAIRQSLIKLLNQTTEQEIRLDEAKERTSRVINMKFVTQVHAKGQAQELRNLSVGFLEGRPILQMSVAQSSESARDELVYDHFHPNPQAQLRRLPETSNTNDVPALFHIGDKSYAIFLSSGIVYDLATMRAASQFSELQKYGGRLSHVLMTHTQRGPMLYATIRDPNKPEETPFVEFDFSGATLRIRTIAYGYFSALSEFKGKNYHYIAIERHGLKIPIDHREYCIFRVRSDGPPQLLDCARIKGGGFFVFDRSGKTVVGYREIITETPPTAKLRTYELISKVRRGSHTISPLGAGAAIELDGLPYYLNTQHKGLIQTNLLTMTDELIVPDEDLGVNLKTFEFDGRSLIFASGPQGLAILDLNSGQIINRLQYFGAFLYRVLFEYEGNWYAYVAGNRAGPFLIQITDRDGAR